MNTRSEAAKGIEEIEVFRRFIARSGSRTDPHSVEKRAPPEPDLLCRHPTEGSVAFELANLCDPELMKVVAAGENARTDAFSTADPSARIARDKLRRTYSTPHPVELLVYADGPIIAPDDVIIPTIRPIFESVEGPYRRAWFMGEHCTCLVWQAS